MGILVTLRPLTAKELIFQEAFNLPWTFPWPMDDESIWQEMSGTIILFFPGLVTVNSGKLWQVNDWNSKSLFLALFLSSLLDISCNSKKKMEREVKVEFPKVLKADSLFIPIENSRKMLVIENKIHIRRK